MVYESMSEIIFNHVFTSLKKESQDIITAGIISVQETIASIPDYNKLKNGEHIEYFKKHVFEFSDNNVLISFEDPGRTNFVVCFYISSEINKNERFNFQIQRNILNHYWPYSVNIKQHLKDGNKQIRSIDHKHIISNPYDFLSKEGFNLIIELIKNKNSKEEILDLLNLNLDINVNNPHFKAFFNGLVNPVTQEELALDASKKITLKKSFR